MHRLKPVLLKTVRIKVWPLWPLGRPFYAMGLNLRRWSRRAHFHCSVGGLGVLPLSCTAKNGCATKSDLCCGGLGCKSWTVCRAREMPGVSGVYWFNRAYRAGRTPRATNGFRGRDAISTRRITKKPMGTRAFAGRGDRFYAVSSRRCEKSEKRARAGMPALPRRHGL